MQPNKRTDAATERAVLAFLSGGGSNSAAGREFGLGESTVRRIRGRVKSGNAVSTPVVPRVVFEDKKQSTFYWRDALPVLQSMQDMVNNAKREQKRATVTVGDGINSIGLMILADAHIGAVGTDYRLFLQLTDLIIKTPHLYVILLGDNFEWSNRLRSVAEQCAQILPIELQEQFADQWMAEIAPKVVASTFCNHSVTRDQELSGFSALKSMQSKMFLYFDGIGHLSVKTGSQTYEFAMSHKFKGATGNDSTRGCRLYMTKEPTIEIGLQADAHVPKIEKYVVGNTPKAAMCCGTLHVDSDYAVRGFSISTSSAFPVMLLSPKDHLFTPLFNVDEFLHFTGQAK
jgi:hypothetical protein